jgi:hypothetical protein
VGTSFGQDHTPRKGRIVKKLLIVVLTWASLAGMLTFVAAGSFKNETVTDADALPAYEIATTVRSMGLRPDDEPVRRGPYYVLHATDQRGTALRVVADAKFGDILSVMPAQNGATPQYQRGPHIIHVPQSGARDERANTQASINDRDEPDVIENDDEEEPPPRGRLAPVVKPQDNPPSHERAPRWKPRSEGPPKPEEPRRAVLSPPTAEGPTPVHPTPRFSAKVDPAGQFGPQHDSRSNASSPPSGYSPSSALPRED